jgi:hypothetical protein
MEFVARYLPWRRTNRAELDVPHVLSDPGGLNLQLILISRAAD